MEDKNAGITTFERQVMPIVKTLHKGRVPVHIYTDDIDHAALQQLLNIANLPIVHPYVAAMPDVHAGIGATVGSVIPTQSRSFRPPSASTSAAA